MLIQEKSKVLVTKSMAIGSSLLMTISDLLQQSLVIVAEQKAISGNMCQRHI